MAAENGKVHVVRIRKSGYIDKQGRRRNYSSAYLRRTYRDGGKVRNETVANLSALPDHVIELIDAGLKGQQLIPATGAVTITRSVPHGSVAAVHAMAAQLGLPALLGPADPRRDLALALIISRVIRPASRSSTMAWWGDTTLGADLGVDGARTGDVDAAVDRLGGPQLIGTLARDLTWHLRRTWAPLTGPGHEPHRSFGGLLDHLATLTRNQVRLAGSRATVPVLAEPTSTQRQAFRLIGVPIPLTLTLT